MNKDERYLVPDAVRKAINDAGHSYGMLGDQFMEWAALHAALDLLPRSMNYQRRKRAARYLQRLEDQVQMVPSRLHMQACFPEGERYLHVSED